jgi:hypothetical protein
VFFAAGFTAASCFSSPASAASEPVYLLLLQPSAGAFSPVRSPELPSYRGCVHHIATQQLGLTVFTVAELKRTQPPLKNLEVDASRNTLSAHVRVRPTFCKSTSTLYIAFEAPALLFLTS